MVSGAPTELQSTPTPKPFRIAKPRARNMGHAYSPTKPSLLNRILMLAASPENAAAPRHQAAAAILSVSEPASKPKPDSESAPRVHSHHRLRTTAARASSGSLTYFRAGISRIRMPNRRRAGTSLPTSRHSEQRPRAPTRIKAQVRPDSIELPE